MNNVFDFTKAKKQQDTKKEEQIISEINESAEPYVRICGFLDGAIHAHIEEKGISAPFNFSVIVSPTFVVMDVKTYGAEDGDEEWLNTFTSPDAMMDHASPLLVNQPAAELAFMALGMLDLAFTDSVGPGAWDKISYHFVKPDEQSFVVEVKVSDGKITRVITVNYKIANVSAMLLS